MKVEELKTAVKVQTIMKKGYSEDRFEGIYYKYFKNPRNKHTLLFLHGFTGNLSIWDEHINQLKDKYNLLLIDLIGHGKSYSPKRIEEYSFKNQSNKILKIVNHLKISSISIICYSYSISIGGFIFNAIPKKVKTIVFISPYFKENFTFMEKQVLKCIKFIWKYLLPNKKFNLDYSKIENYEKPTLKDNKYTLNCINTKDVLGSVYSFANFEKVQNLKNFNTPLLIIYGKDDEMFSKKIKNRFKECTNIEFKVIKNKKHLFLKTMSKEIIKEINSFLIKHLWK